jgi:hypothetical protein
MCGNARELVLDVYDRDTYRSRAGQKPLDPCVLEGALDPRPRVLRGGSFEDTGRPVYYRERRVLDRDNTTGFRVALSEDGSPRPRQP